MASTKAWWDLAKDMRLTPEFLTRSVTKSIYWPGSREPAIMPGSTPKCFNAAVSNLCIFFYIYL